MSGEMRKFVEGTVQAVVQSSYPHMKLPALVAATVTASAELGGGRYEYTLQITDSAGVADAAFPEIPRVRSKLRLLNGQLVAVGLLYGEIAPLILGEVEL